MIEKQAKSEYERKLAEDQKVFRIDGTFEFYKYVLEKKENNALESKQGG